MEYAFHTFNHHANNGVSTTLQSLLNEKMTRAGMDLTQNLPVVVCVGSDLIIGDSLGPMVGSMIAYKTQGLGAFVYGTLAAPVTAKEVKELREFLKRTHPRRAVSAVDAAVGAQGDIGLIKISNEPLYPGAGTGKQLGCFGDASVIGIVAEKSLGNYALLHSTRLRLVYRMAEQIADGIATLLYDYAQVRAAQ